MPRVAYRHPMPERRARRLVAGHSQRCRPQLASPMNRITVNTLARLHMTL